MIKQIPLQEIFKGLKCGEFDFREDCFFKEKQCISLPSRLSFVREDGPKNLALHLIFDCKTGVRGTRFEPVLNLSVQKFHITARTVTAQERIDAHGPSILEAAESIHINRNTVGWGRDKNLEELLRKLNIPRTCPEAVLRQLNPRYSKDTVPKYVDQWKQIIKDTALANTRNKGIKKITFHDCDKTFPEDPLSAYS